MIITEFNTWIMPARTLAFGVPVLVLVLEFVMRYPLGFYLYCFFISRSYQLFVEMGHNMGL